MLEGTPTGRRRNSEPMPTGHSPLPPHLMYVDSNTFVSLPSEVRFVEILDSVCRDYEVSE